MQDVLVGTQVLRPGAPLPNVTFEDPPTVVSILPAGAICADFSDIGIDGYASFTSNSAGFEGGEKHAGRPSQRLTNRLVTIPCKRAPL